MLQSVVSKYERIVEILAEKGVSEKLNGYNNETANEVVTVLEPFKEATEVLEGEKYPTVQFVVLWLQKLESHCNAGPDDAEKPPKEYHQAALAVSGLHLMYSATSKQFPSVSASSVICDKEKKRNDIACSSDFLSSYRAYNSAITSALNGGRGDSDVELPSIMAKLKLRDVGNEAPDDVTLENMNSERRITRSCSKSTDFATQNRRFSLKPAKMDVADIESYYLNKKYQRPLPRHLETIYEEPVIKKNGSCCILGPKKSRKIHFTGISKAKEKKRKANIKKLSRNFASRRVSFSADDFLMHLTGIMLEDVSKSDMQP